MTHEQRRAIINRFRRRNASIYWTTNDPVKPRVEHSMRQFVESAKQLIREYAETMTDDEIVNEIEKILADEIIKAERAQQIIRAYDAGAIDWTGASIRLKAECGMSFEEAKHLST